MNNTDYVKVKIEGFYELDKIAIKYNIDRELLREFHNSRCKLNEIIPKSLSNYLEYIYIPTTVYEQWKAKQVNSTFVEYPFLKTKSHYGFTCNYFPQKLIIQNKYQIERNNSFIEISKEKTFVNNQELDLIVEQMLEKVNEALYPLHLEVNNNGEFDKIINGVEIQERWNNIVYPKLNEYYKSELSSKIFSQLDTRFSNFNSLKELLHKTLFYQIYFFPIYQDYPDYRKMDNCSIYFSSLKKIVEYEFEVSLEKEYTSKNKILITVNGKEKLNNGKIYLVYKLDKEIRNITSVIGEISTHENNQEYKIDIELYELD